MITLGDCGLRIQTRHHEDSWSVSLNVRGLSWGDSNTGLTQQLAAGIIWRHVSGCWRWSSAETSATLFAKIISKGPLLISPRGLVCPSQFGPDGCVPKEYPWRAKGRKYVTVFWSGLRGVMECHFYHTPWVHVATKFYPGSTGRDKDPNHRTGWVSRSHCKQIQNSGDLVAVIFDNVIYCSNSCYISLYLKYLGVHCIWMWLFLLINMLNAFMMQ